MERLKVGSGGRVVLEFGQRICMWDKQKVGEVGLAQKI